MIRPEVAVLTAADSLGLVTLDVVKDELGIAADNDTQDARLSRYIAQVSAQIHSFCQRIFPAQTYRNIFLQRHFHHHHLALSQAPVIDVLSISTDGAAIDDAMSYVDPDTGILHRMYGGARETIVDFRAGYEEIPADIQAAALRTVTLQKAVQGRDPYLKVREGPIYGREEFWVGNMPMATGGLPQDVAQMLEPYMRRVFA